MKIIKYDQSKYIYMTIEIFKEYKHDTYLYIYIKIYNKILS